MSFQAIIRNAGNAVMSNTAIGIRISLIQGSPTGNIVYTETQNVRTNYNGLVSLQIGTGTVLSGNFSLIDWANGPYFIKTETDINGGNDYSIIGSSELLSVPYALFALNTSTSASSIGLTGAKGTNGTNGTNGTDGIIGLTGAKGITGNNGTDGANGTNGTDGTNGINGTDGTNGTNGTNGTDGIIGLTGAKGITGNNGTDGTNGINGTDGINGTNGINAMNSEPIMSVGTVEQYLRGDKSWQNLNSTVVGLNNVDNTSDLNKPISIATTEFVLANSDRYNVITAGNEISTTSSADILAQGMSFSPPSGKYIVHFNSQYTIEPGDKIGQASVDLNAAYANLMSRPITNSTHGLGYGAGEILGPGVYNTAGAVTTTGTLTLDAGGNDNAEFIFQFGAAMSTGAGFKIILANGAKASNIYWIAEGAIALGANTEMKGMLISNSGAVTLGSMTNLQGNIFSSGAIGIDASTIYPTSGALLNFGSLANFAIFAKTGAITNVGGSYITGDIAARLGAITGFETATINGSILTSVISNAIANFSVYQNGVLIPYSTRKRTSSMNMGEITLQALATIAEGENIDIRWNIDLGKVKMQNRIFTIQHVR